MAGFSEAAMSRRLQTLNTTQQSVQMMSMWLLHHQKSHAETIVKVWLQEIKKETKPVRLINLLYLANDVIQNSRKHCPHFMGMFYENLEPAFRHVSLHADADAVVAMKKILRVFRERQIYSDVKVDRLMNAVTSSLTGIRLVEFNIELGGTILSTESIQKSRQTPTTPPIVAKTVDSPHLSTPTVDADSPEPKKSKVDSENFDIKVMTRVTEDVISLLKKLEDPPSADAETRQLIASFPETIANPALLKPIRNESQAMELLKKIKEAEPVVKKYCKRLATEMEDRRFLQQLLPEYFGFLKSSAVRNDEMLRSVREKVEKLEQEKASVKEHFDSLPDLADLPSSALSPLPSLGELFKSGKNENEDDVEVEKREE
uniref:CID domain-containing protein n=1 Tax=Wuchereria bancrofti TaxID=6293 RepID=A0AAF5PRA1_WUCBA